MYDVRSNSGRLVTEVLTEVRTQILKQVYLPQFLFFYEYDEIVSTKFLHRKVLIYCFISAKNACFIDKKFLVIFAS